MSAQEPMKVTDLERVELADGKTATVLRLVEVQPNIESPRHMHPDIEVGYVVKGAITFTFDGQAPKSFRQGDSFSIALHTPHVAKAGPDGVKLLNTFVVEKDKPLAITLP